MFKELLTAFWHCSTETQVTVGVYNSLTDIDRKKKDSEDHKHTPTNNQTHPAHTDRYFHASSVEQQPPIGLIPVIICSLCLCWKVLQGSESTHQARKTAFSAQSQTWHTRIFTSIASRPSLQMSNNNQSFTNGKYKKKQSAILRFLFSVCTLTNSENVDESAESKWTQDSALVGFLVAVHSEGKSVTGVAHMIKLTFMLPLHALFF